VFEEKRRMRLRSRQWARVDFAVIGFSLGWLTLMDPGVVAGKRLPVGHPRHDTEHPQRHRYGRLRAVRLANASRVTCCILQ